MNLFTDQVLIITGVGMGTGNSNIGVTFSGTINTFTCVSGIAEVFVTGTGSADATSGSTANIGVLVAGETNFVNCETVFLGTGGNGASSGGHGVKVDAALEATGGALTIGGTTTAADAFGVLLLSPASASPGDLYVSGAAPTATNSIVVDAVLDITSSGGNIEFESFLRITSGGEIEINGASFVSLPFPTHLSQSLYPLS